MREIKFRAWLIDAKIMIDVYALELGGNRVVPYECDKDEFVLCDWYDADDKILLQYTGLKDKNGKEIYEGDVIKLRAWTSANRYKDTLAEVGYLPPEARFMAYNDKLEEAYLASEFVSGEVVGNIYKDKELLNENQG